VELKIQNARIAFPKIWTLEKRSEDPNAKPSCGCTLIIEGGDAAQIKMINDAMVQVAKDKWKNDAGKIFTSLKEGAKLCFYNGARKAEYAGYDGNMALACNANVLPLVVDRRRNKISESDGVIYPGCYVNAVVDIWAQDHPKHGKRINCAIKGIQFVKDGDSFGGGGAPAKTDDFAPLDDDAGSGEMFGEDFGV